MAVVISLCSSKGGVSKSTSTVELASIFTKMKKKVLVIDLDENCSLSKNVGAILTTDKTSHEALLGQELLEECVQHLPLFDILVGSKTLSLAEKEFAERDDIYRLQDLITYTCKDYDYVFVDNAPSRSILLTMTYVASDYIIIPTQCDESSLDMVDETERDIQKLVENRNHDSHAKVIGYILSSYRKTNMHEIALDVLNNKAANNSNGPFVEKVSEAIRTSTVKTLHTSVAFEEPSSITGREYYNIANKTIQIIEGGDF